MVSDNVWLESIYKYSLKSHKKNYFHQNMHNRRKSEIESRRGAVQPKLQRFIDCVIDDDIYRHYSTGQDMNCFQHL